MTWHRRYWRGFLGRRRHQPQILYGATALVALARAVLSFVIARRHTAPRLAPVPEQS